MALERLEPYDAKVSRTVLMGLGGGNTPWLPGDFDEKGVPKGSPLSPLLGAVALIPLDKAMGKIKGVFYSRFMDDWVVLTKSKTALRKVVKITHEVVNALKFQLHPLKTYIGKISHG